MPRKVVAAGPDVTETPDDVHADGGAGGRALNSGPASAPAPLRGEVRRLRLDRLLDAASGRRLTLVVAGAGWGKTTAVAGWAQRCRAATHLTVAWLSLEPADDDPVAFWGAVLEAVAGCEGLPDDHPVHQVNVTAGFRDEVRARLFEALSDLVQPLVLVLDDFQVIADPAVLRSVSDLLEHETSLRLMILTRSRPDMPLHRMRLAGYVAEIGVADLAFDAAAIEAVASAEALTLSPADVEQVLVRTEGWPAGVRLAALYLSRPGESRDLAGFLGTDKTVAEYLAAEVLAAQDAAMREFLLRTSIVDRVCGDLANALVSGGQGQRRLEELENRNQFTAPADSQRVWFRYHPLLRDLLEFTLRHEDPEGFLDAHRAAAAWFASHGKPIAAMRHAIAARDWDLACASFVAASPSLVSARRSALRQQLVAIPYSELPPSARLELCAAALHYIDGHVDGVESAVRSARRLAVAATGEYDALSPSEWAVLENLACAPARVAGDLETVTACGAAAAGHLAKVPPGPVANALRVITLAQLGHALLWSGDPRAAHDVFRQVPRTPAQSDVSLASVGTLAQQSLCDVLLGRLDDAQVRAGGALRTAAERGWLSAQQARPAHLAVGAIAVVRGQSDEADRALARASAAVVGGDEQWLAVAVALFRSSAAATSGRTRAAAAALAQARDRLAGAPLAPVLRDHQIRAEVEFALLTDRSVDRTVAVESIRHIGGGTPTSWICLARLEYGLGNREAAAAALDSARRAVSADTLSDAVAEIEGWLVAALIADAEGNAHRAMQAMAQAVQAARPERLVRPFLVTGTGATTEILRLLDATMAPEDTWIRDLLAALKLARPRTPEPSPLGESLTDRELAVLALLPTLLSNAQIAARLYVSVNTVKAHLKNLYRKLDVSGRREAVNRARGLGLLP